MHYSFGISLTNQKEKKRKYFCTASQKKASRDSMKGASPSGKRWSLLS